MKKSLIWEMRLLSDLSLEALRREVYEKIVVTSSRTNGLLVNPIHEDVEELSISSLYQ